MAAHHDRQRKMTGAAGTLPPVSSRRPAAARSVEWHSPGAGVPGASGEFRWRATMVTSRALDWARAGSGRTTPWPGMRDNDLVLALAPCWNSDRMPSRRQSRPRKAQHSTHGGVIRPTAARLRHRRRCSRSLVDVFGRGSRTGRTRCLDESTGDEPPARCRYLTRASPRSCGAVGAATRCRCSWAGGALAPMKAEGTDAPVGALASGGDARFARTTPSGSGLARC